MIKKEDDGKARQQGKNSEAKIVRQWAAGEKTAWEMEVKAVGDFGKVAERSA